MASEITGLSVKVSAAVSTFNAGMSRAQDAASDLSLSLRRLGMSSESAERDLDSAGRSATTTAAQMGVLTGATNSTNTSFMGLSATIWASMIPAVVTLGAALTPIVAALGGLATIGAAIGGVGLVSVFGAIATNTEFLKEEFMDMVGVLESEFAPMFDLAASVLVTLINEFERIIPALVPAEDVLSHLAGNFAALGSALIDVLPALAELATTLAVEFLPPFVTWVQDVLPGAPDMLRSLVSVARDVLPMFMDFGRALMNLLPPLNEFGLIALPIIADALGWLNGFIIDTLQFVNDLENGFTSLVAGGSLILPFLVGLVSFLGGPLTLALAATVGAVVGLARAFQTNFANIRSYLTGLWNEFKSVLPAIRAAFDAFVSGINVDAITAAVGRLETALGTQLMATLNALRPVFAQFSAMLRENKQELKTIGEFASALIVELVDLGATVVSTLYPAIRTFLIPALSLAVDTIGFAIDAFAGVIQAGRDFGTFVDELPSMLATGFGQMLVMATAWANSFRNLFVDVWNFIIGGFGQAFNDILGRISSGINGVISLINQAIETIPWDLVPGQAAPDMLATLDAPEIDAAAGQFERATTDRQQITERVVERVATITVENGEIVAKMEDEARTAVNEQQRSTRRRQGRAGYDV